MDFTELAKIVFELLDYNIGSIILIVVLVFVVVAIVLTSLEKAAKSIGPIVQPTITKLTMSDEEQRLVRRHQLFARHIKLELENINSKEEWQDDRFAELEAEVETNTYRYVDTWIPFYKRKVTGLHRETSLSTALENTSDRIILLEGAPGAGKSVALRHVATRLAEKAEKSNNLESIIPVYINLKQLNRQGEPINSQLIEDFVLQVMNRPNNRDVAEYLDDFYQDNLNTGKWLFLFDSFDEMPDILGSTQVDDTIDQYTSAISDFLAGMNLCRGIIASRPYRGPSQTGWTLFVVQPLNSKQQRELIRRSDSRGELEKTNLFGQILSSKDQIKDMATNPMFLSLLCNYMKAGNEFPTNIHSVYDEFINERLIRDEERINKRFSLNIEDVKKVAEQVAFCMLRDESLGLNATRDEIKQSLELNGFGENRQIDKHLDALIYIKLARSETEDTFTFSHRRFQEYFSTLVVSKDINRITPEDLITNARWRETAVVILQTQPLNIIEPILNYVENLLTQTVQETTDVIFDIQEFVDENNPTEFKVEVQIFKWKNDVLHVLGILQDSVTHRAELLSPQLYQSAEQILVTALVKGTRIQKNEALLVAGILNQSTLEWCLQYALSQNSEILDDSLYRQITNLKQFTHEIRSSVLKSLVKEYLSSFLFRNSDETRAYLSRIPESEQFLMNYRYLKLLAYTKLIFVIVLAIILFSVRLYIIPIFIIILGTFIHINSKVRKDDDILRGIVLKSVIPLGFLIYIPIIPTWLFYEAPNILFVNPTLFIILLFSIINLNESLCLLKLFFGQHIDWLDIGFSPIGLLRMFPRSMIIGFVLKSFVFLIMCLFLGALAVTFITINTALICLGLVILITILNVIFLAYKDFRGEILEYNANRLFNN